MVIHQEHARHCTLSGVSRRDTPQRVPRLDASISDRSTTEARANSLLRAGGVSARVKSVSTCGTINVILVPCPGVDTTLIRPPLTRRRSSVARRASISCWRDKLPQLQQWANCTSTQMGRVRPDCLTLPLHFVHQVLSGPESI